MKRSMASKAALIIELLGGRPILDEEGNDTGEVTASLITKEEAVRILGWTETLPKDEE